MKNKISLAFSIFLTIFCLSADAAFTNVCCIRDFDISMSAPGVEDVYRWSFEASIRGGFTDQGYDEDEWDCPIDLQLIREAEYEYLLERNLTAMPSDIKGNYYIFTAKLIDRHHGNTVIEVIP